MTNAHTPPAPPQAGAAGGTKIEINWFGHRYEGTDPQKALTWATYAAQTFRPSMTAEELAQIVAFGAWCEKNLPKV